MIENLEISKWLDTEFDLIIDARSPREFRYSRIDGAINFYALNNNEYNKVGIMYKKDKQSAKIYGASVVCKNIASHILQIGNLCKTGAKIGIYCARGGMRSNSIATVLSMSGYRVYRLDGGYKAYRNFVLNYLAKPCKCRFITLFGNTGSAKTKLIDMIEPSINIEKLANHLGSTFGSIKGKQPSQKFFENEIFTLLKKFEEDIVFIEGESAKLGTITIPKSLNLALHEDAFCVDVKTPLAARIQTILEDYSAIDDEFFFIAMQKITPFIKKDAKIKAINDYENGDLALVAENLLLNYYDKVYKKPQKIDFILHNEDLNRSAEILKKLRKELLAK